MRGKNSSVDNRIFNSNRSLKFGTKVCGIINLGNNCYLNSGLQILASCEELTKELKKNETFGFNNRLVDLLNRAFDSILFKNLYDPEGFIEYFCNINYDFIKGSQACSQNFIRTLIRNINDCCQKNIKINTLYNPINSKEKQQYNKFLELNKIYPESNAISIFSCINKTHSAGKCPKCGEKIDNYSFSYFIDQNMYLDEFYNRCKFSEVLKANIGNESNLILDCPRCKKEIEIKEETKIIKLPEILIFTLERYQGQTNKVKIEPDKILDMKQYIDKSINVDNTLFELFAINIRFGSTANFGHEICQVKRNGKWYEINDSSGHEINELSYFDSSYGLFYRKIKNDTSEKKAKENIFNQSRQTPNIKIKNNYDNNIDDINYNKKVENNLSTIKEKFDKNISNDENKYINCAFQIIGINNELYSTLNLYKNIQSNIIINTTKNIINDIRSNKNPNFCELINCLEAKNQKVFYVDNENSIDFLTKLIKIMNEESLISKEGLILKYEDYLKNQDVNYIDFIRKNKLYPQSNIYSIFSLMTRHYTYGKCIQCKKNVINNSYDNELNYLIYLPKYIKNKQYDFSKILKSNIENAKSKEMRCPNCKKKNNFKETTKIIKFPEIFIFHLNRFVENNNIINKTEIIPDNILEMSSYSDYNLKTKMDKINYKLFAVYIMKNAINGSTEHICQIAKDGGWYEFNNGTKKPIPKSSFYGNSCGLYYKRC